MFGAGAGAVVSCPDYFSPSGKIHAVWKRDYWRGWVQMEPRAHRAATVSPLSRAIDISFGVAVLATMI